MFINKRILGNEFYDFDKCDYFLFQDLKTNEFYDDSFAEVVTLIKSIFSMNSENIESISKEICNFVEKYKPSPFWFFTILLVYGPSRPKNTQIFLDLLIPLFKKLFPDFESLNPAIYPEKMKDFDHFLLLRDINDIKSFSTSKSTEEKRNSEYEFLYDFYDIHSVAHMILNDDVTEFQKYIANSSKNANEISFKYEYPFNYLDIKILSSEVTVESINFAAFFGSIKIFKFILLSAQNESSIFTDTSNQFAIAGGNPEIIHIMESKNVSFDNCFETAVQYHRYDISDFLLLHYKCQQISSYYALKYVNYESFLYSIIYFEKMKDIDFFNEAIQEISDECMPMHFMESLFNTITKIGSSLNPNFFKDNQQFIWDKLLQQMINTDSLEFLLKNGFDPNFTYKNSSEKADTLEQVISKLFPNNQEIYNNNKKAFYLLVDHGADVNKGNPLLKLCYNPSKNIGLIKYLLDHGADVNAEYNFFTPLSWLCKVKDNFDYIKLLIDYGADVNKGTNKPLTVLCRYNRNMVESAKLLLENGAKVNDKGCIDNFIYRLDFTPLSAIIFSYHVEKHKTNKVDQISLNDIEEYLKYLKENDDLTKLLISKGANEEEAKQMAFHSINKALNIEYKY